VTPFEAYKLYNALKQHFRDEKYNFFKYNGKTKLTDSTFEKRKDKYFFKKLSLHPDPKGFLIANFSKCGYTIWIGDLVKSPEYQDNYRKWAASLGSLSYNLSNEISSLSDDLSSLIKTSGDYPKLFQLYVDGSLSTESLIAMDYVLNFISYWDKLIDDPIFYQDVISRVRKYKPFVQIDMVKIKKILKEKWG